MTYIIKGKSKEYEMNIGLEIHCQVISNSKLFSSSSTKFGCEPNTNVSFFDSGFPGQLPVINKFCVEQAIKTGLGLNAKINKVSVFDRKHYFYADLPTGYQITQQFHPIVSDGFVEILDMDGNSKKIRIEKMHIEQDAGKLTHDVHPTKSMVDFNRAGVALMEIVSKPDISSPFEAGEYIKKIRSIVRYLGTCDGNMDEGSMRCDINISLREKGSSQMGIRTETKNVNSVRFAMQAIEYESNRQMEILENGGQISQETRLFDANTGTTRTMRSKENAIDYRYFPDPDIMPLVLEDGLVERIKESMPELPDVKKKRFVSEYKISDYDADVLTAEREISEYFEEVINTSKSKDAKMISNWMQSELFAVLNKEALDISNSPVSAAHLAELVDLIKDGSISGKIAKDVFKIMWEQALATLQNNNKDDDWDNNFISKADIKVLSPKEIVEKNGWKQVSDTSAIEAAVDNIIAGAADNVSAYKSGKVQLFGWFVGQVLKAMKGQANPQIVNEILKKKLG